MQNPICHLQSFLREELIFLCASCQRSNKRKPANNGYSLSSVSLSSIQTTSWHRATTRGTINPALLSFKTGFPEALERIKEKSCNQFWQSHPMILMYIFKICGPKMFCFEKAVGLHLFISVKAPMLWFFVSRSWMICTSPVVSKADRHVPPNMLTHLWRHLKLHVLNKPTSETFPAMRQSVEDQKGFYGKCTYPSYATTQTVIQSQFVTDVNLCCLKVW